MPQSATLLPTSSRVIAWPETSSISSPFGSSLPNRAWSDVSRGYRYGFNGKEKDTETANDEYDFGARIYDGRLGRWLSLDPLMKKYPDAAPYLFTLNCPNYFFDYDGRDIVPNNDKVSTPSFKGPKIKCISDIARMDFEVYFKKNNTGGYDFHLDFSLIYSQEYNEFLVANHKLPGEGKPDENLANMIRNHEYEHRDRYLIAANSSFKYNYNNSKLEGRLDEIFTKINLDLETKITNIKNLYDQSLREIEERFSNDKDKTVRNMLVDGLNERTQIQLLQIEFSRKKVKDDLLKLFNDESESLNEHDDEFFKAVEKRSNNGEEKSWIYAIMKNVDGVQIECK